MRFALTSALSFLFCVPVLAQEVTTVAGSGIPGSTSTGYAGDGGLATNALLRQPQGVGLDGAGNLFFADNQNFVIRRVDAATGFITTVAGNGISGFGGDGGPATLAQLGSPVGIFITEAGDILIADQSNHRVRKVSATTGIITTIAGSGVLGFAGDGSPAAGPTVRLNSPQGVCADLNGNIYIADTTNRRIRYIGAATGNIGTIAGTGVPSSAGDGGLALSASFQSPRRIMLDFANNIFIVDAAANSRVRRIDAVTGIITTVAGGGALTGDSNPATSMNFGAITDVATDGSGNLVMSTSFRLFRVESGIATAIAGTGAQGFGGEGGPPLDAVFNNVSGLAVNSIGEVLLSDRTNDRIRKVTLTPSQIEQLVVNAQTLQSLLDALEHIEQSLIMTSADGRTTLIANLLESIGLDFIITENGDLVLLSTPGLLSIGGILRIEDNLVLTQIAMPSLTVIGGDVFVNDNLGVTDIDLGSLTSVGGSLTITNNPEAGDINLGSLTSVGGSITVSNNPEAGDINLGSLTSVGGSLVIETQGQSTVDLSGATVAGNTSVTAEGASVVAGQTAGGTTSVTMLNGAALMSVDLAAGTFGVPVPFSVESHAPETLAPAAGVDASGNNATIEPLAAYTFSFEVPTLGQTAVLSFELDLSLLSAGELNALLNALSTGSVTLAVRGDAPGSMYQAFGVCGPGQTPALDLCVSVTQPTANTLLFSGIAGHFSTWAVAIVTPMPTYCPADIATIGGTRGSDGQVTIDDLVVYLSAFFAGDIAIADKVGVGGSPGPDDQLTVDDLVGFLTMFFGGCP